MIQTDLLTTTNPESTQEGDSLRRLVPLPRVALSIRQPWAWLIVNGWKNVENRMWRTRFRGPVLIHAGKAMTRDEYRSCQIFMAGFTDLQLPPIADLERGGIVGVATILDCVDDHASEWFVGQWGFVMADQRVLQFLPHKGALGFFPADYYWDEARVGEGNRGINQPG